MSILFVVLLLKDEMNTEEAKTIASACHTFIECFLAELRLELEDGSS